MSKFAMLGYVIVFLLAFALLSVALGFFKAAFQQRKADKAAAEEKRAEEEAKAKAEEEKKKARQKGKQGEKKKIKRLDE